MRAEGIVIWVMTITIMMISTNVNYVGGARRRTISENEETVQRVSVTMYSRTPNHQYSIEHARTRSKPKIQLTLRRHQ